MKKSLIIIAAALLSLAACSKVTTVEGNADEHAISFQVANYVQTKAPVAFSNEDFGTYAWYNADDESQMHVPFMVNEQVTYDESAGSWWTYPRPYYWPKLGSLDFISYSPYRLEGTVQVPSEVEGGEPTTATRYYPEITEDSITWTDFNAYRNQVDLMYSDKAVDQRETSKKDTYTSVSGVKGVPTLFHHALAKLNFEIRANFLKDAAQKTTWEVYVQQVNLKYVRDDGSLGLALNQDGKTWVLPDVDGNQVWTFDETQTPLTEISVLDEDGQSGQDTIPGLELTTTAQSICTDLYVIPQILRDPQKVDSDVYEGYQYTVEGQQLEIKMTIVTHLPGNPDDQGKPLVITENITRSFLLKDISALKAWQMNQDITYVINIKPTANVDTPDNPEDVVITFDPAVGDWQQVTAPTVIQF